MQTAIWIILIYFLVLIVWLVLNLVVFAISYLLRRSVSSILLIINMVINFVIYITFAFWGLFLYWNALINKQWLLFVILLIIGSFVIGFYQIIVTLILMPFSLISSYFTGKTENYKNTKRVEYQAEYLSPEGKVMDTIESDDLINKKLATFFLLDFFGHLVYLLLHPQQYKMYGLWDYIFTPFFFLLQDILFFILMVLIFNRFRHGRFIYLSWRSVITQTLKLDFFLTLGIQILAIILYIFSIVIL